ncbi:U32 family peptidase [Candidatus Woesearchaeota archaeon]|nr:MAG: U32 family peptidase [Candidatus Woesearchaeota archaeon]
MTELLAPAGNWPALRAAVEAGADAVYFGVKQLNMRITTENFDIGEIKKITEYCHESGVKAYLTLNVIIYDEELPIVKKIITTAKNANIDAIIAWDNAVLTECKRQDIRIHLSTQASVSNYEAVKVYASLGVKRIILARELSIPQIAFIKKQIKKDELDVELETFVHGAMCVAISGRCFTSQFVFGKSANRGNCLQPCRREYIVQDTDNEITLKLGNNYVMSAKDLCALPFLNKLVEAEIDAFKVEGRNKQPEYVKTVVEVYREALNSIEKKKFDKKLVSKLMIKLRTVYNRDFSSGFFLGKPLPEHFADAYGSKQKMKKVFLGFVGNYYPKVGAAEIKLLTSGLKHGNWIMFQGKTTGVFEQVVSSMEINNKKTKAAAKGESVAIKVNRRVRKNDKVFLISYS